MAIYNNNMEKLTSEPIQTTNIDWASVYNKPFSDIEKDSGIIINEKKNIELAHQVHILDSSSYQELFDNDKLLSTHLYIVYLSDDEYQLLLQQSKIPSVVSNIYIWFITNDGGVTMNDNGSGTGNNLLDNSDFIIQRRKQNIESPGQEFFVDRWSAKTFREGDTVIVNEYKDGVSVTVSEETAGVIITQCHSHNLPNGYYTLTVSTDKGIFKGTLERTQENKTDRNYAFQIENVIAGYIEYHEQEDLTAISVSVRSNMTIYFLKLEEGKVSTTYRLSNKAIEQIKCQRYYNKLSHIQISNLMIQPTLTIPIAFPSMQKIPVADIFVQSITEGADKIEEEQIRTGYTTSNMTHIIVPNHAPDPALVTASMSLTLDADSLIN